MPKEIEQKLMKEARKKFHSVSTPRAKSYIWGTMRNIEKKRMKGGLLK